MVSPLLNEKGPCIFAESFNAWSSCHMVVSVIIWLVISDYDFKLQLVTVLVMYSKAEIYKIYKIHVLSFETSFQKMNDECLWWMIIHVSELYF